MIMHTPSYEPVSKELIEKNEDSAFGFYYLARLTREAIIQELKSIYGNNTTREDYWENHEKYANKLRTLTDIQLLRALISELNYSDEEFLETEVPDDVWD